MIERMHPDAFRVAERRRSASVFVMLGVIVAVLVSAILSLGGAL